jgi:hypothetical protein
VLGAAAAVTISVLVLTLNNIGNGPFDTPALPLKAGLPPTIGLTASSAPPSASASPSASEQRSAAASASPRTTAPTSRPATGAPAPRPGSFAATYELRLTWSTGHISRLTVRNTGPASADWSAVVVIDAGIHVDRYWTQDGGSAELVQNGTSLRLTGRLGAGNSVIVEYQVSRPAGASTQPRSCVVNGSPCG